MPADFGSGGPTPAMRPMLAHTGHIDKALWEARKVLVRLLKATEVRLRPKRHRAPVRRRQLCIDVIGPKYRGCALIGLQLLRFLLRRTGAARCVALYVSGHIKPSSGILSSNYNSSRTLSLLCRCTIIIPEVCGHAAVTSKRHHGKQEKVRAGEYG